MKKMFLNKTKDFILVLTLIFFFAILFLYFDNRKKFINCIEANKKYEEQNSFLFNHISKYFSIQNLENEKINFYNINGGKIKLKKVVVETKIILKYPEKSCDCFDNILNSIKKLPKTIREKIIIIVPKNKFRYYYILFSDFELNNVLIIGAEENLKISDLDNGIIPYFFILDENLICKNFFLPISNHNEILDLYLQYALNNYFYFK